MATIDVWTPHGRAALKSAPPVSEPASSIATTAEQFVMLLLKEFAPGTARDLAEIQRAVRVLAEQALHDPTVISEDAVATIKAIIAKIDTRIAQQENLIVQHGSRQ